ncbi:hypothetical protein [Anaerosporobacter sp.]
MQEIIEYVNQYMSKHYEENQIGNAICYLVDNGFVKISPVKSISSVVIEYAENKGDAENNLFEDSGMYEISLGKEKILELIKREILQ